VEPCTSVVKAWTVIVIPLTVCEIEFGPVHARATTERGPLHQLLVEFAFDSRLGQKTTGTMNPGFAYVAVTKLGFRSSTDFLNGAMRR
jgi:hypothetical protein